MNLTVAGSPVVVARGTLDRVGAMVSDIARVHRIAIVTDSNVGPLYASRISASLAAFSPVCIPIRAGEQHKTRSTWSDVSDELLAHGLGRDAAIVALGGGVVGDLAGFVAATYLRGIPVVQVPTSLVAMIDASIGGKTGVDVPAGKNLVGAFHPPILIAIDPDLLTTLPPRERRSGLAEALKHGAIADAEYFARVATIRPDNIADIVERSVEIKANVVNDDPREANKRKILNFGHTLGHAIEAESGYTLAHGEAIAIGMVYEARLGEQIGVTEHGTAREIERALLSLGLPTSTSLNADAIVARTVSDKKARAGVVEYALPSGLGRFDRWTTPASGAQALSVLKT